MLLACIKPVLRIIPKRSLHAVHLSGKQDGRKNLEQSAQHCPPREESIRSPVLFWQLLWSVMKTLEGNVAHPCSSHHSYALKNAVEKEQIESVGLQKM